MQYPGIPGDSLPMVYIWSTFPLATGPLIQGLDA
jgi:hypothetical protein